MKFKSYTAIALALGFAMLGSGCGSTANSTADLSQVATNLTKSLTADLSKRDGDSTTFATQNLGCSVDFFKSAFTADKNTLTSSLSLTVALAMTANGAKGETKSEMESVLGAPMSEMNPALAAYMKKLEGYSTDKVTLSLADSIWMKDEIAAYVKSDFLQTNKDYYDAEIYSAPFDATTTSDVNNWISDKTQGMIDKMLDESKEPKGIMYLINTLYFSGEWSEQYSETDVYTNNFYLSPENPIAAEFMRSAESTYLSDENTTGFIKPYKGGKLAFAALLPDESLTIEEYVATMSETKWENLFKNKKSCTVFSQLPKFAYDFSFNAGDALCAMGMPTAFDEVKADFSDMATLPDKNVFISFVLQNTHIEVDTNGTKAAAATIVGMDAESSTIMETKTVLLDRPFLYAIIDTETNYPLFLGAVVNPKQS